MSMEQSPLSNEPAEGPVRILGIETSCDETAAAVVENGRRIIANQVASQADLHAQFGGVFPEVASRQHIRTIHPIVERALQDAHLGLRELDAIAVTRGPGLPGSLVVGMNMAKGMALGCELPLIGVNHIKQMMRNTAPLFGQRLIRADVQPAVNLAGIGGDDFAIKLAGQGQRQGRFAHRSRPHNDQ